MRPVACAPAKVPNLRSDGLPPATAEALNPDLLNAFSWSGSAAKEGDGEDALRLRADGVLRRRGGSRPNKQDLAGAISPVGA